MNEHLTPQYITTVASTIYDQIKASTSWSVRGSWGAHNWRATVYKGMAALVFQVSGLLHKGYVYVAYNDGADTYEVILTNIRGTVKKRIEDVYCDNLGYVLNTAIERGTMSSEEYHTRALADSAEKMVTAE